MSLSALLPRTLRAPQVHACCTCLITLYHSFRRRCHLLGAAVNKYEEAAPSPRFPGPKWFLAVYIRDVWSRLPGLRAAVTSVFGSILKVDSTKKVCHFQ